MACAPRITTCRPRQCVKHSFRESHCLGVTRLSEQEVEELLHELAPDWSVQARPKGEGSVASGKARSQWNSIEPGILLVKPWKP